MSRRGARPRFAFVAVSAMLAVACAAPHPRPPTAQAWVRTELVFGLSRPGGADVTAEEWAAFVRVEIVPRFPGGFTLLDAQGHWDDGAQPRSEPSRVLMVVHAPTPELDRSLEELRRAYRSAFQQQSVLRVDSGASVSF